MLRNRFLWKKEICILVFNRSARDTLPKSWPKRNTLNQLIPSSLIKQFVTRVHSKLILGSDLSACCEIVDPAETNL